MGYVVASGHVESLHNGRMVGPGDLITRGVNPRHRNDKRLIDRGALVKRVTKTPAAAPPPEPEETGGTNQTAAEPQKSEETK